MKRLLIIIAGFVIALLPHLAKASSVSVVVDTGVVSINVLEATINLPYGFKVNEIQTGGSALLFWLNTPKLDEQGRSTTFSGITPGGFRGKREILTLSGDFSDLLAQGIYVSKVIALKNDGAGTPSQVHWQFIPREVGEDTVSPEAFSLSLARSPDLFSGEVFISFATQDKDTGVSHYLVAEKLFGKPRVEDFTEIQSPYAVHDQLLLKKVFVKAVDLAGNEQWSEVALPNRKFLLLFLAIIISVPCVVAFRRSRKRLS